MHHIQQINTCTSHAFIHIRMLCVYIFAQCDGSFPSNPSTEFNLTTVDGWLKDWQPSRWIKRETVRVCQGHALLPQSPVAFVSSSSWAAVPWASQNCRGNTCWVRSLAAGLDPTKWAEQGTSICTTFPIYAAYHAFFIEGRCGFSILQRQQLFS